MPETTSHSGRQYQSEEEPPPPRPKRAKHPPHGGAWKVAYADFVTAMMALFIVLWVMNQSEEIKQSVAGYFKDPIGFNKTGGQIINTGTAPAQPSTIELNVSRTDLLEKEISRMKDLISESERLKNVSDQVVFQLTDEGIRLEFRDASKFSFFAVGSAQISAEMKEIIRILTPEVAQLDYGVVIEGHTDRRPYGAEAGYTNWELSADRANGVRRAMLAAGLAAEKMTEVRAYADTRLLDEKDPFALENRRVSILLKSPVIQVNAGK